MEKKKDAQNWDKYWEYHSQMVTDTKLVEMRHPFHTNGKESLNMRNAEVAPKHKNFSRTPSLNWRIQNVIGVHNIGYSNFYEKVMRTLEIKHSNVMASWWKKKDRL